LGEPRAVDGFTGDVLNESLTSHMVSLIVDPRAAISSGDASLGDHHYNCCDFFTTSIRSPAALFRQQDLRHLVCLFKSTELIAPPVRASSRLLVQIHPANPPAALFRHKRVRCLVCSCKSTLLTLLRRCSATSSCVVSSARANPLS
jgi:hypothetical protein